ncbi:MAG TPA: response regulator [Candidatus Didemnitutus sp.]|jgi:signal transduction histidine kinase
MISVLYAEDDPNVASVVRSYFDHFGEDCTLEVVTTGNECLQRMGTGGVDVLLLDLRLPDIDGLHILGELAMRHDPTPVVMISGHGQNDLAVRALRAGAVDCVDKSTPQFLQVVDIVKRVHAAHRATRPIAKPPAATGPYRAKLIEGAPAAGAEIRDFINRNAPNITLEIIGTPGEYHAFIRGGFAADAILIGPHPALTKPLDVMRQLHSEAPHLPVVMLATTTDGEAAVAAFKLGAQDYILQKDDYLTEMVFSLNSVLRRVDIERQNVRLARELAELNHSLELQVTERTAELRALSSRLLKIQEDERRAIARELHDQVGQMLTGLKFQLEAAAGSDGEASRAKLVEAQATAKDLMHHVRELTQLYRPRILDDLGLRPALEWHATLFQRQTGISVSLDLNLPPDRLPPELETVIFRITQEALTNIARHAGTKTADVTVTTDSSHLLLEISDRGRGFDLDPVLARRDAVGLAGIRERVNLAGGRFEIFSQPGQGTRLHAALPLAVQPTAAP